MVDELTVDDKKDIALVDDFLKDDMNLGMEEVEAADLPTPTLTLVQNTSKIQNEEGQYIPGGKFYYKARKLVMDEVYCSFLVMQKKELPDYNNRDLLLPNHVYYGAMDPDLDPFVFYLKSTGLSISRKLLGDIKGFRKPMYSLWIHMQAVEVDNGKGRFWKPKITVVSVRDDIEVLGKLKRLALLYNDFKNQGPIAEEEIKLETTDATAPVEGKQEEPVEPVKGDVNPDDIPF